MLTFVWFVCKKKLIVLNTMQMFQDMITFVVGSTIRLERKIIVGFFYFLRYMLSCVPMVLLFVCYYSMEKLRTRNYLNSHFLIVTLERRLNPICSLFPNIYLLKDHQNVRRRKRVFLFWVTISIVDDHISDY